MNEYREVIIGVGRKSPLDNYRVERSGWGIISDVWNKNCQVSLVDEGRGVVGGRKINGL